MKDFSKIRSTKGQTALILILLSAAALIFYAITINWGRIAEIKTLLTVAADQSAAILASNAASYGEMEKQQSLDNKNYKSEFGGLIIAFVIVLLAVVLFFFVGPLAGILLLALALLNFTLQAVVVQPGISSLWNKQQRNQPPAQQFFEQGIANSLQGVVQDHVKITDYTDINGDGFYGTDIYSRPFDVTNRFDIFYNDRLKMLNQGNIPQVTFFYNQLGKLINGESCATNALDNKYYGDALVPLDPLCKPLNCALNPALTVCQIKIPNGFQLSDPCLANSDPSTSNYTPYCDPCCQVMSIKDTAYKPWADDPLHPTPYIMVRPSNCPAVVGCDPGNPNDPRCVPDQCVNKSNPYGNAYPYLYDPSYQNYGDGKSFLAQFGRDQQKIPGSILPASLPLMTMTTQGDFPNGIYPFFWMIRDYSLLVNNIDPGNLSLPQTHWCAAPTSNNGVKYPQNYTPLSAETLVKFPGLASLNLTNTSGYACQGKDCCVNYLADSVILDTQKIPTPQGASSKNPPIDNVGSASFLDQSFGESSKGWIEGDNQFCGIKWPYNGSSIGYPDGSCPWTNTSTTVPLKTDIPDPSAATWDSLDNVMHTLSDFSVYANSFLDNNLSFLSANFDQWYSQASVWFAPGCMSTTCQAEGNSLCNENTCIPGEKPKYPTKNNILPPGHDGRLLSIYNPYTQDTKADKLQIWEDKITNWLLQRYDSQPAWCVPDEQNLKNISPEEESFIKSNGGTGAWGDLPHVIACLNYNASQNSDGTMSSTMGPLNNFTTCEKLLPKDTCPKTLPPQCSAVNLGRSLAGPNPNNFNGNCDSAVEGSFAKWVKDSAILATDEAPKFALRAKFLGDIYKRALVMKRIFAQGDQAIKSFLKPCGSDPECHDGGPAAQLMYAHGKGSQNRDLPNSVIYGWVDATSPNGDPGYAHLVKVTAYSPGRGGSFSNPYLPYPKTSFGLFDRSFWLEDRDGDVYVSVRRWDQPHRSPVNFSNGHLLWQTILGNPKSKIITEGNGLPKQCISLNSGTIGYGLQRGTLDALFFNKITPKDLEALGNAFMLNDRGDGGIDAVNGGSKAKCSSGNNSNYCACLKEANDLLASGIESHACARYIASRNASGGSGDDDADYSLKFVPCSSIPPEDLVYAKN